MLARIRRRLFSSFTLSFFLMLALTIALAACASTTTPGTTGSTTSPQSTVAPSSLWYLLRGTKEADESWGVDVDSQGNVYYATYQSLTAFPDWVIYKIAPDGKELWRRQWGRQWLDKSFVVTVAAPYVYIGGTTYNSLGLEDADMALIALNMSDGGLVWERTWDQAHGYEEIDGIVVDGDSVFVSGWTAGKSTNKDLALLKLTRAGEIVWARSWGSAGWDEANGHMVVDADRIYLAGRYNAVNFLIGGQGLLASFSKATGEHLADTRWGPGGLTMDDALGLTTDGKSLYTVSISSDQARHTAGQIVLRRYTKDLHLEWEQAWGGSKGESARALVVDPSGDLLVAGTTESFGGGKKDIALLRFTSAGKLVYSQYWGDAGDEQAFDLVESGAFVYIAGVTSSFGAGKSDGVLLKAASVAGQFGSQQV